MSTLQSFVDAAVDYGKQIAKVWEFDIMTYDDFVDYVISPYINAQVMTAPVVSALILEQPEILHVHPWQDRTLAHAVESAAYQLAYHAVSDGIWEWAEEVGLAASMGQRHLAPTSSL